MSGQNRQYFVAMHKEIPKSVAYHIPHSLEATVTVHAVRTALPAPLALVKKAALPVLAFLGSVKAANRALAEYKRLSLLSDHELEQIGVAREDLPRIVLRNFA